MHGLVLVRGLGSIGRRHAEVFADLGLRVVGWPVRERPAAPGEPEVVGDTDGRALLPQADLVVVATDTARHVQDTLTALDGGARRVLLEKPVAPTVHDTAPLLAHPRAHDDVWVAAPLRAHEGFDLFRRAVEPLATPRAASVWSQSWLPGWRPGRDYRESYSARADEGGALRDLVHEIDYAAVLFGEPRSVSAVLDWSGPLEMEAEQAATLLWAGATTTVTVRVDYVTQPTRRGALVTSPSGTAHWDPVAAVVTTTGPDGSVERTRTPADLDRNTVMARQARAALELAPSAPLDRRLAAGCPATLEEAVRAVRVCDTARACSPEGDRTP